MVKDMKQAIPIVMTITVLAVIAAVSALAPKDEPPSPLTQVKEQYTRKQTASVDHSKFPQLQRNFTRPQEVTEACIGCHNGRHVEVMQTAHWRWEREEYVPGRGVMYLGKRNSVNNFCLATSGNEQRCAKCHVGYGMTSVQTFDFNDPRNVDCLVCHDRSATYVKASDMAGYPDPKVNLSRAAQSVGRPTRDNCGTCHFFGGGGNNVKHGDMDMALSEPTRELDVHMAVDGANMQCVDCHTAEKHNIRGQVYSVSSMNRNRVTCEGCHTTTPHRDDLLNEHTLKVACQTCHIPTYAKAGATVVRWDWSTFGRLRDGKPYEERDADGNLAYKSIMGSFEWGKNLKPDYVWFNGTADHYMSGDRAPKDAQPILLNRFYGSYDDPDARIVPVKIMRTRQFYDPVNQMLALPLLFATERGKGALWQDFNPVRAAEVGMKERGLPFSGQIDFAETVMYWNLNHMVAPKEQALSCTECHTRNGSRIANLRDFYLPGRDHSPALDGAGKLLIALTLLGVLTHGGLRVASGILRRRNGGDGA